MHGESMCLKSEEMNINTSQLLHAFAILDREVENGTIPGAVAIVGRCGYIVGSHATGYASINGDIRKQVELNTIYDCASLTKVVVTLPLILMLLDRGDLHLGEPVANIIPEFAVNDKSAITIKHLLTHTSGLTSHRPYHSQYGTPEEIKSAIYKETLEYPTGEQTVYSDLGFIVLGEIVSRLYGIPLDEAADRYLFQPLGMKDSQFCPSSEIKERIAATEYREWLLRHQRGEVHDENAAALGGVSGHAGLFSTAYDLARYAMMWIASGHWNNQTIISQAAIQTAIRNQTIGLAANRGLGWVLKDDRWDASGDLWSPSTYGHTGFTGTSMWMDLERELFVVLLTNRVHFGRGNSISKLRACFHNAVAASLQKVGEK